MKIRQRSLSSGELARAVAQGVAQGGSFTITVTGGSMTPTLLHGRTQVELTAPGEVKPGDIVLVQRLDGSLVLHRAIRRRGDTLTLNGDAQRWTEQAAARQVIGKVSRICRRGKWLDPDSPGQRAFYRLWGLTRPVRPWIFRAYTYMKGKKHERFPEAP